MSNDKCKILGMADESVLARIEATLKIKGERNKRRIPAEELPRFEAALEREERAKKLNRRNSQRQRYSK